MNYSKKPLRKHQKIKNKLEKATSDLCSKWNGEYPAGEDIPLPPYHTNCQCSAYYIETDDEDNVNDLDLEVEEIKDI